MGKKTTAWVEFRALERVTAPIRKMYRVSKRVFQSMRFDVKKFSRQLRVANQQVNKLTSGLRRVTPGLGLLSAGGLLLGGKNAVQTFAQIEALGTSIEFASGSAKEGGKNMKFLKDMSKDLAIDFMSAAEGFKLFTASAAAEKVPMDQIRDTFKGVSKMIRVQGLDAEKTISIYRALGQMYSKTRVMAQEMNLQLAEALPGGKAWMAMAGKYKNVAELSKEMELGNVISKEILPEFGKILDQIASPGVMKAMMTANAKITNLANAWLFLKMTIGEMIVNTGVLEYIDKVISSVYKWLDANKQLIGQNMKKWFDNFVDFAKWIIVNRKEIISIIKGITLAFITFKAVIIGMNIAAFFTNPIGLAIAAVAALIGLLTYAIDKGSNIQSEIVSGQKHMVGFLEQSFTALSVMWDGIWELDMNKIMGGLHIMYLRIRRMFKSLEAVWHSINPRGLNYKKELMAKALAEERAIGIKQAQIIKEINAGTYSWGSHSAEVDEGASITPERAELLDRISKKMPDALEKWGVTDTSLINVNLKNLTNTPMEAEVVDSADYTKLWLTGPNGEIIR